MAASSSVSGRASAEAELSDVSDTESVRMADLTASRWSLSDLPDSGGSEISTASAAWDAGYAYGLRLRGSSSEALGIRRMDVSHRAHHLCVLSTAVAMHQAVCVGFWRFLLPGERRFVIAACRELDFYCLQAVRNAGGRSSSIAMAFSTDSASATEAVPGPLVHRRRRTHRERFPLDRLVGSANVFRDGVLEMSLDYHGALTMSEFLSATAETCSRTRAGYFCGWQVASVDVHLRSSVAMPAFGASLEETSRQALYIAFRAMGGFAKRFARRRRQGRS